MFLKKTFPRIGRSEKRKVFDGFSTSDGKKSGILFATGGANCDCADGCIRAGAGLIDYLNDSGVNPGIPNSFDEPVTFAILPYAEEDGTVKETVAYVSGLGLSYVYNETIKDFEYARKVFYSRTKILKIYPEEGGTQLAFCCSEGIFLYDRTKKFTVLYSTGSDAACTFHERLFFAEKPFTVRFSAPLDCGTWEDSSDESGAIEFTSERGEIIELTAFKEAIYIFRERGIEKLDAKGAARDFSHETLSYGGGNILIGSVGICGEDILFLAEDGLYAFDGAKARRLAEDMPVYPVYGEQVCEHGTFGNKYFLKYSDRGGEKKLLVWDRVTGSAYFSLSSVCALSETENRLLCFSENKLRQFAPNGALPTGEEYVFVSENVDFGSGGRKVFKTLTLKGGGVCLVEIGNEYETKNFVFDLGRGVEKAKIALQGERFDLKFVLSDSASYVSGAEVEFDVLE